MRKGRDVDHCMADRLEPGWYPQLFATVGVLEHLELGTRMNSELVDILTEHFKVRFQKSKSCKTRSKWMQNDANDTSIEHVQLNVRECSCL